MGAMSIDLIDKVHFFKFSILAAKLPNFAVMALQMQSCKQCWHVVNRKIIDN